MKVESGYERSKKDLSYDSRIVIGQNRQRKLLT
ncbi:hypothetical protein YN1HA_26050 [Sulfurisphaera ohwakuensis]